MSAASGAKRGTKLRPVDDDEDGEAAAAAPAPAKRARTGDGVGGASASAAAAASSAAGGAAGGHGAAEFEDDEDEDGAEYVAAYDQRMPGTILRVRCINLRCHAFIDLKFKRHINFITGRNGSGKSSILTAIRLAQGMDLRKAAGSEPAPRSRGAAASAEEKAPVDCIVRTGETTCCVDVDFANEGVGAMDPTRLGRWFRVRRIITRRKEDPWKPVDKYEVYKEPATDKDGALASSAKPVKDMTKTEMGKLFHAANIFHSNPCMVMDQETGKTFFTGNAAQMYQFFVQATGLAAAREDLAAANDKVRDSAALIDTQGADVSAKTIEFRHFDDELKMHAKLIEMKQQLVGLEKDMHWAKVNDATRKFKEDEAKFKAKYDETKLVQFEATLDSKLETAKQELKEAKEKVDEITEKEATINQERDEVAAEISELVHVMTAAKEALGDKLTDIENAQKQVTRAEGRVSDLAKRIASKPKPGDERAKWEARNAEIREGIAEAEATIKSLEAGVETKAAQLAKANAELKAAQETLKAAAMNVKQAEADIAEFKASKDKAARMKDPWTRVAAARGLDKCTKVLNTRRDLDAAARSGIATHGPIFTLAKVQPEWAEMVEISFMEALTQVIVEGKHAGDLERTRPAFKYAIKPKSTERYPASRFMAPLTIKGRPLTRLYDVIEFEDAWAFNAFADETTPDKVVLCRSYDEADALLRDASFKSSGIRSVFAMTGGGVKKVTIGLDGRLTWLQVDNPFWDRKKKAVPDSWSMLRPVGEFSEADVSKQLEAKLLEARTTAAAAQDEARKQDALYKAAHSEHSYLERDLSDASKRLQKLQNELSKLGPIPPAPVDDEVDEDVIRLEALKGEVAKRKEDVKAIQAQLPPLRKAEEDANAKREATMERLAEIDARSFRKELEDAEALVQAKDAAVLDWINRSSQAVAQLQLLRAEAATKRAELKENEENLHFLRKQTEEATGMPGPAAGKETQTEREARREHDSRKVAWENEQKRSKKTDAQLSELKIKRDAAKVALDVAKELHDNTVRLRDVEQETMKKLRNAWRSQREILSNSVSENFKHKMARKGHEAMLVIKHGDHEDFGKGQLEVYVSPDKAQRYGPGAKGGAGAASSSGKDTWQEVRSLSGGEKSTATLTLLSAIAQASPVPFRLIDEFDVFQDEATRKFSLKTLLEQSMQTNTDGRKPQFILLTPHDVSAVFKMAPKGLDVDQIHVLQLQEPDRHGRAGVIVGAGAARGGGGGGGAAGAASGGGMEEDDE